MAIFSQKMLEIICLIVNSDVIPYIDRDKMIQKASKLKNGDLVIADFGDPN